MHLNHNALTDCVTGRTREGMVTFPTKGALLNKLFYVKNNKLSSLRAERSNPVQSTYSEGIIRTFSKKTDTCPTGIVVLTGLLCRLRLRAMTTFFNVCRAQNIGVSI